MGRDEISVAAVYRRKRSEMRMEGQCEVVHQRVTFYEDVLYFPTTTYGHFQWLRQTLS